VGAEITREEFSERDYARFRERLEQCLTDLGRLLGRPGFGAGPATIGAELELCLVDDAARPLPRNADVRALAADPRIALELTRFNLELNASPALLTGPGSRPFTALAGELGELLALVGEAARAHRGRIALIGILPTLSPAHLDMGMVTDAPRYRALDRGLQRLRRGPVLVRIGGAEPLEMASEHVTLEGANTSFQVHLRVDPGEFTRVYNAAQLATAPVLAVAGNSPTFLGRRLWEETRIALFMQSVEDRASAGARRGPPRAAFGTGWLQGGALELFTESVRRHEPLLPVVSDGHPGPGEPALNELRLHQGTVWRWNRAIYDPAAGGHLRIEMRALPAGPTVTDMLANAAFLIGLTLWLAGQDDRWTRALAFQRVRNGFYHAAQSGLAAELSWPADGDRVRTVTAADLVPDLLPAARQGLLGAGVDAAEADHLLGVISARVATGQTGAAWQRTALAAAEHGRSREQALAVMLDQYLACAATGQPVHTWPSCRDGDPRPAQSAARHPPLQPGAGRGRARVGGFES
jgi:gamma-glutamyl:cysteine ligase YbdK (ATP-grasp superfamily)